MLSARFVGLGTGLLALVFSILVYQYYFLFPLADFIAEREMSLLIMATSAAIFVMSLTTARRNTAEALRLGEQRYLALFRNMTEGVAYLEVVLNNDKLQDCLYLDVNAAWESLIGLRDLVGRRMSDTFPGKREFNADLFWHIQSVALTGIPERFEVHSAAFGKWLAVALYRASLEHVIVVLDDITVRKQALESLRQSEFSLAEAQRVAKVGNWEFDIDSKIVRWSDELCRIFEFSPADPYSAFESFLLKVYPEDRERVTAACDVAGKSGDSFTIEYRIVTQLGALKHIRAFGHAVKDSAGRILGLFGVAQDITEYKNAEIAMRRIASEMQMISAQKEAHLQLVIDTIPAMAWSATAEGGLDFVNQRWLEYSGLSREEALQKSDDVIHPEDRHGVTQAWTAAMASGHSFEKEIRLRDASGEYRWFLVRTVPLRDEQGRIAKWYGTSTDIEDHRRAEEALRESEEKFRQIAENIREVFWMATPPIDKLLYISPAYETIWERPLEALSTAPRSFLDVIHDGDRERVLRLRDGTTNKPFELEYRIVRPDGSTRWIRDRAFPIRNSAGEIYRIAGVADDITERKHAELAVQNAAVELEALSRRLVDLQESERMQLASELHDRVGQTLTALNINLKIIANAVLPHVAEEVRLRLADAQALLESAMEVIGNVMAELHPPMLEDQGLLSALRWYANQFAARAEIAVVVRGLDSGERLEGKIEIALFRIAQEALNNVVKHARANHVEITVSKGPLESVMTVQDDGIGLDACPSRGSRPAFGMITMRERSLAVGGALEVKTIRGSGACVTVRVPA